MSALVRCEDAALTYGRGHLAVVAVHAATCAVRPGDRIALTGPSGSGKSTLLHLMAGLEVPTSGRVCWPGLRLRDPVGERPGPVALGVVFQGPSLLPPLDVTENVAFPLLLRGIGEAEARRRACEAMRGLGVHDLAGKLPEELSGGQAQRVAIARVLASAPVLILADEPTGQLDRGTAEQVITVLLAAARAAAAALVISTHDETVAARLATRWRIHDGRLSVPPATVPTATARIEVDR